MEVGISATRSAERTRLRAGAATLDVFPEIGGAIGAFWSSVNGARIDWLRPADDAAIERGDVEAMGCFPLVPFSNRVRNGCFVFDGVAAFIPPISGPHAEHGHGWRRPWRTIAQDLATTTIEFEMRDADWPFPYRARQNFRLSADRLDVTLSIENLGKRAMPVGLGLHPYFPRQSDCRLTAKVEGMWNVDTEVMPIDLAAPPPRDADPGRGLIPDDIELDNCFTGWDGAARIDWPARGTWLAMRASKTLRHLVVYSPRGESYFCAEPVSHCTDAFNLAAKGRTDTGALRLEPDEAIAATTIFQTGMIGEKE